MGADATDPRHLPPLAAVETNSMPPPDSSSVLVETLEGILKGYTRMAPEGLSPVLFRFVFLRLISRVSGASI